jgi:hypothetical protein
MLWRPQVIADGYERLSAVVGALHDPLPVFLTNDPSDMMGQTTIVPNEGPPALKPPSASMIARDCIAILDHRRPAFALPAAPCRRPSALMGIVMVVVSDVRLHARSKCQKAAIAAERIRIY